MIEKNNQKILAIIPARGGSKGIPRKNIRLLAGKPLIAYSIEAARQSRKVDRVIVSTEDTEIAKIAERYGAEVIKRPQDLAKDDTPTESVIEHVLYHLEKTEGYYPSYVMLLQPTSPLREPSDIDCALKKMMDENADSLLSVCENDHFLWSKETITPLNYDYTNRPRRQEKEWELLENGSIYITKTEIFLKEKNRLGGKITTYMMPKWKSFEIDELFDFQLVEYIMTHKLREINTEKMRDIKMVIFDVDGVFTDGSIYLYENGKEMLQFSRIDGKGIELLRNHGVHTAVITSENSQIVKQRMIKLKIDEIFIGIKEKSSIYEMLKEKYSLTDKEICFCGDDIQDLELIKKAGLSCCPQNAQESVAEVCDYRSPFEGGHGFVRDVCNKIVGMK